MKFDSRDKKRLKEYLMQGVALGGFTLARKRAKKNQAPRHIYTGLEFRPLINEMSLEDSIPHVQEFRRRHEGDFVLEGRTKRLFSDYNFSQQIVPGITLTVRSWGNLTDKAADAEFGYCMPLDLELQVDDLDVFFNPEFKVQLDATVLALENYNKTIRARFQSIYRSHCLDICPQHLESIWAEF